MDGFGIKLAINALKTLAFIYDIITYPIYFIIQNPWRRLRLSKRIKAIPITNDTTSVTYRSVMSPKDVHISLVQNKIDTMDKMFNMIVQKYGKRKCLGTRKILNEEDEIQPNGRVFKKYNMGEYQWKTYNEVNSLATQFGFGLNDIGCQSKKGVAIFAETRAEWMIAAQALFKQNIPLCTIYATLGDEGIIHALNETEVEVVITSYDLLNKIKVIYKDCKFLKTIIYMEDQLKEPNLEQLFSTNNNKQLNVYKFSDIIAKGVKHTGLATHDSTPNSNDLAIIMYTSGSTGTPKGVMITHRNLIATLKGFCDYVDIYPDDILIGFLPLAHVFELLAEHVCLLTGIQIGYSSALTMIDTASKIKKGTKGDATVLKPTCMTAVPLILDRVSKGIQDKVNKGSMLTKILFKFAYDYKLYWLDHGMTTPFLDQIIFKKIKQLLGGRIRLILVGGAPLSPDTHQQTKVCLCEHVIQGYGLTETTSMATVFDYHDLSYGRVGGPTTMTDVRLINWDEGNYRVTDKPYPRGELIIGGDNITLGYFKLNDKTLEEYFEENDKRWFKTGDIGEIHPDGVVKIIDRKKDLVKLQAGEYVSLGKVEAELNTHPLVDNICVYGDSSKQFTIAFIVPNQKQLEDFAVKKLNLDVCKLTQQHQQNNTDTTNTNSLSGDSNTQTFEMLCKNKQVEQAIIKELVEYGKKCKLEKFEVPAAIKLCTEVWTPDMGLLTAAFKLKRKNIQEYYQNDINKMYLQSSISL
ncbi:long-chain-fatty-acid--CoA ligase 4 isoform X2 [Chrysoperla carnea]|uniref:long-chain-fatty-acid--CoA ligase 4 isoform X2 n=1 Tax=Chrysoperla carnea TaxID=189513 RepID=UPI001D07F1DB|nr:long-chain-fatty-acid--CoA ligase 4 isoform X2 [Chrysoperla carnea]